MFIRKDAIIAGLALSLAGCSIHPLPHDVTGLDTATIVRKIRCEARQAVIDIAVEYSHTHGHLEVNTAADLRAPNFIGKFGPYQRRKLMYFATTGIVYAFSLEGTETAGLTLSANVIRPLTHGTESLMPSAGDTLRRDNIRTFTISDNFHDLIVTTRMDRDCSKFERPGPNYQYPIVGKIGIEEMIRTFIVLALFEDLGVQQTPAKSIGLTPGPPAMADQITFTTTITGGLTPGVTFTPVGSAVQLASASLIGSVMRVDTHQVTIGLGLPTAVTRGKIDPNMAALVISSATQPGTGEAAAAQAVAQQIIRYQLPTPLVGAAVP
jgi:hypothetical protein